MYREVSQAWYLVRGQAVGTLEAPGQCQPEARQSPCLGGNGQWALGDPTNYSAQPRAAGSWWPRPPGLHALAGCPSDTGCKKAPRALVREPQMLLLLGGWARWGEGLVKHSNHAEQGEPGLGAHVLALLWDVTSVTSPRIRRQPCPLRGQRSASVCL